MKSSKIQTPKIRTRWLLTLTVAGVVASGGCHRDVRLAGRKLRDVTVETVTHFGVTLDKSATPEQVAYVLLRAIRNDFHAKTSEDRNAALDVQLDLAAADFIQARNRSGSPSAEFIFNVVNHWTPTVSHYVDDFETDFASSRARFRVTPPRAIAGNASEGEQCEVLMEVKSPNADPAAHAVLIVWMVQDEGYWRVTHLGFDPSRRRLEKQS